VRKVRHWALRQQTQSSNEQNEETNIQLETHIFIIQRHRDLSSKTLGFINQGKIEIKLWEGHIDYA
jgi:hypothetical protein